MQFHRCLLYIYRNSVVDPGTDGGAGAGVGTNTSTAVGTGDGAMCECRCRSVTDVVFSGFGWRYGS